MVYTSLVVLIWLFAWVGHVGNWNYGLMDEVYSDSGMDIPTAKETIDRISHSEYQKIQKLENDIALLLKKTDRLPIRFEVKNLAPAAVAIVAADTEVKGYTVNLEYDKEGRCIEMSISAKTESIDYPEVHGRLMSQSF